MNDLFTNDSTLSKIHVGIDPGSSSGSIAWIQEYQDKSKQSGAMHFSRFSLKEISDQLLMLKNCHVPIHATVEKVHAMPGQGVTSMFSFGENYGQIQGVLMGLGIAYDIVTPQTWQKMFVPPTKGKKILNNKTKDEIGWKIMSQEEQKQTKKNFQAHNSSIKAAHKKSLKEVAERLFPEVKVINQTADALLLAEYCRR